MNKKSAFNILRVVVSAGLVIFLFWLMRDSLDDVIKGIKRADKTIISFAFLCTTLGMVLLAVRLKLIMKTQHLNIKLKEAVPLTFIGYFFNNFLPTTIGGDLVKIYYVAKGTGKKMAAVASIIMDRLLGTFTFILMALFVYFFVKEAAYNKSIIAFIAVAMGISLIAGLVLFSKRAVRRIPFLTRFTKKFQWGEKMKGLYEILYNYKKQPALVLNAITISIFLQIVSFYAVYLITKSLSFSVSLKWVFLVMPLICVASMAPSINGLGVRESAFVFFFSSKMGKEGAFALSILYLALNFGVSLIGGVSYLFKKDVKIKEVLRYDR